MSEIITQLGLLKYLNVGLVIVLFAIGYIIKHTPSLEKIDNKYIPYVLVVVSLVYNLVTLTSCTKVNIVNAITDSIISAAIAIGLHQYAKSIILHLSKSDLVKDVIKDQEKGKKKKKEKDEEELNEELDDEDNIEDD